MATPIDSSIRFQNVTPSDTVHLKDASGRPKTSTYISFAVAGALAIKDQDNNTVIIPSGALVAGHMHKIQTGYVLSTGTGATGIVAYFND